MGCQKVKTGQPVNSGQGLITIGQTDYVSLFLAGGSYVGTLIGLARKR